MLLSGPESCLSELRHRRHLPAPVAGAQYSGHEAAVMGLAVLPGPGRLVASVDAAGALHLWSAASGALSWRLEEPDSASGSGLPGAGGHGACLSCSHCMLCMVCPLDVLPVLEPMAAMAGTSAQRRFFCL